jgi:hypothetical protein
MAFNFPPAPTVGQVYKNNGRTFQWNGNTWTATAVPTNTTAPVFISISPPPNPIPGSLWYDANNSNLNIYYKDFNGSQWVAVVPYPDNVIDQQGGVFDGAVYLNYEIPNNPLAAVTVGYVDNAIQAYLTDNLYLTAGNGVSADTVGNITRIDSGLVI